MRQPRSHFVLLVLFIQLTAGLAACTSRPLINDVMVPYGSLKALIASTLPGGVTHESVNGRELRSAYFSPADFNPEAAGDKNERAFADVTILGSSRPYQIDVKVYRQRRGAGGRYSRPVPDEALAQRLASFIKESLAHRREDRNVIDDFRAF